MDAILKISDIRSLTVAALNQAFFSEFYFRSNSYSPRSRAIAREQYKFSGINFLKN
jgi:hypothetical protein